MKFGKNSTNNQEPCAALNGLQTTQSSPITLAPSWRQLQLVVHHTNEGVISWHKLQPGIRSCTHDYEISKQLPKSSYCLSLLPMYQAVKLLLPSLLKLLLLLLSALLHSMIVGLLISSERGRL